ncbi:MAG: RNA methyltransferase [Bacteroidales bacterium]|nr:RNA methyltransferase [Bacteroidales bacterium]
MISKNKIKYINSLKVKKYRKIEKAFICEGAKIFELLVDSVFRVKDVFATAKFIADNFSKYTDIQFDEVEEKELSKISSLTTPQEVIAIVEMPDIEIVDSRIGESLALVLDKIQDPGNLGTIIRIADWFGIEKIICSEDSVDVFSPKVVQATMGSIFTVKVYYKNLEDFLQNAKNQNIPIFGTFMDGENIYSTELLSNGIIVLGNEGNGITPEIEKLISHKISIPDYNKTKAAESLNVAVSAAIVCAEFRRRI